MHRERRIGGRGCIEHDYTRGSLLWKPSGLRDRAPALSKGPLLFLILAGSFSVNLFSDDIFCTALGAWFTKGFWSLDGHKSDSYRSKGDIFSLFSFFSCAHACLLVLDIFTVAFLVCFGLQLSEGKGHESGR